MGLNLRFKLGYDLGNPTAVNQTESTPLSDADAHSRAMTIPIHRVVYELIDLLGLTLVAAIGGVNETRAVVQWLDSRKPQKPQVLRFTLQLALMISGPSDGTVARSWLQGSNPYLGDRSPAMLLRHRPLDEIQAPVMEAAREFAVRSSLVKTRHESQ